MFKVGIIGLGHISDTHLENFFNIPDVAVNAVADINVDNINACAAKYSVGETFRDYRELLAIDDLDLVVVCLPNNLHARVSIDALDAGHHVLCEKPMATSVIEAEAMIAAAAANQRALSIVMNFRWQFFGPDIFYLKRLIENSELGEIYHIRAHYLRRVTFPLSGYERWNLSQEESGGGVLIDLGPHMLDLAMWLVNDYSPVRVNGITHKGLIKESEVDDFASGSVSLQGGTNVQIDLAWNSHNEPSWQINVYGENGGAVIDADQLAGQRIRRFMVENGEHVTAEAAPGDIELPPEVTLQEHVVNRILAGETPDCSAEKALQVMKVIEGWYKSAATGRDVLL